MKVGLVSLGCARTLVDSEVALGCLKNEGYEIVSDLKKADIGIVNTCGFIEEAKVESIDAIIRLCDLKKKGKLLAVVVLGCLAQRHGEELRKEIGDEVDAIIGTDSFDKLPTLLAPLKAKHEAIYEVKGRPRYLLDENTPRVTLTPDHFAYVKISEGCINACSYCVIPQMKGPHRSRTVESVVAEIRKLVSTRRLSEINLIGQDTAAFGYDRSRVFELPMLLREIQKLNVVPWTRVLYAHPGHVTEDLVRAIAESASICKYVDFPIEHSHDDMLLRMNRGVDRAKMEWGIRELRKASPGITIRTTVIVGFPGETEVEFQDLMDFLKEYRFERLGAFMYSQEEGSRSYGMDSQIAPEIKQERYRAVMELQRDISQEINDSFVGKKIRVLIDEKETAEEGVYNGRSEGDAPDVDCQVIVHSKTPLHSGQFVDVKITDAMEYDLVGTAG